MATQQHKVRAFFDRIAPDYNERFQPANSFHYYFFNQRLLKATKGLDVAGKSILDVGAGTGPLFDLIKEEQPDYWATDISQEMLSQSNIPVDRQLVGELDTFDLGRDRFDYIFILGVTSYLSPDDCRKMLANCSDLLKPGGEAIVSFTQNGSIDHYSRVVVGWPIKLLGSSRHVMGQGFDIQRYRTSEVRKLCGPGLRVADVTFLNQTVFPFNRMFGRASIGFANWLENKVSNRTKALLSSDFLVRLKKL